MMWPWLALCGMAVMTAAAQLLIKTASERVEDSSGLRRFVLTLVMPSTLVAGLMIVIAACLYIYALTGISLSTAYASTAIIHVLVFFGGWILFQERKTTWHLAGIVFIVAGVVLYNI